MRLNVLKHLRQFPQRYQDDPIIMDIVSDTASDTIDALVAEVEQLRAEIAELRDPTYKHVPIKGAR